MGKSTGIGVKLQLSNVNPGGGIQGAQPKRGEVAAIRTRGLLVRRVETCLKIVQQSLQTFAVSAAFVFGDHLGFTAGFAPEMMLSMIVAKLVGGISAVAVALLLTRKDK